MDNLCSHLPNNLGEECQDFVNTYSDELVEMLIADLNPQQVCVYLKLCTDKEPAPADTITGEIGKAIALKLVHFIHKLLLETNQIHDYTYNGKFLLKQTSSASPQCVLCEFIMKEIDDKLKDKNDEVRKCFVLNH